VDAGVIWQDEIELREQVRADAPGDREERRSNGVLTPKRDRQAEYQECGAKEDRWPVPADHLPTGESRSRCVCDRHLSAPREPHHRHVRRRFVQGNAKIISVARDDRPLFLPD